MAEITNEEVDVLETQSEEKLIKAFTGVHTATNRINSRNIDNGVWRFTNERMFFKFGGFGRYEVSAYYDEIEYIASVGMGYYVVHMKDGVMESGKSDLVKPIFYWGTSPFKMKDAVAVLTKQIGSDRVAPPARGKNIAFIVMLGTLAIILIMIIFGAISGM